MCLPCASPRAHKPCQPSPAGSPRQTVPTPNLGCTLPTPWYTQPGLRFPMCKAALLWDAELQQGKGRARAWVPQLHRESTRICRHITEPICRRHREPASALGRSAKLSSRTRQSLNVVYWVDPQTSQNAQAPRLLGVCTCFLERHLLSVTRKCPPFLDRLSQKNVDYQTRIRIVIG